MSRIYVPVQVDRFLGYRSDLAATVAEPGWATELLNAVINHVGWLETRAGRKCYVFNSDILIMSEPGAETFTPQQLGVAPIYGARSVGLRTVRFYAAQEGLSSRIFCLSLRPHRFRRVGRGAQVVVPPDDPAQGIGEVLLQVDYNLPRLPVTNWQVWATVPSGDWTLEVDPLRVGQWAQARTSDDPIMGFRRGLYCINLAPLGETGLILDRDVFQAYEILQFWGYKQVDGSIRPLFAPTLGEPGLPIDLGGLGYYRFPLGVGQWIVVPDIYNGDYRIGWTTQWVYEEDRAYPRKVLTALANHTGELEAPMPLLLPPSEHEEVEWGLGLYRFKLPKAQQQISNPPYRPYLGSPDRTAALLSTEPDGVALLKFWEAVALTGEREGVTLTTTTVPGVFVDFDREYTITNGDGSEYTNIAAPVEIDDAADVYVWDDVKVKYRLVWKGNPELLESEKEHEEIARTAGRVVVRTSKKLAPGAVREYYFEYAPRSDERKRVRDVVEAVGSAVPTDADLRNPHQRNAAFPADYVVKPSDLRIGGGEIKQRNTGVRRRKLPKADGESRDLPMAMWRYRFMWEYEDGSFSAVSHPVVAYDTLWSVADDETLLALRLRHRASERKVVARAGVGGPVTQFERSPRLSVDEGVRREFPDAHLAARPYNAVRGVIDLLRPSLTPEMTQPRVEVYRDSMEFAPVPLRSIYSVPRFNTWGNSMRFTWDRLEEALARYWSAYLKIRARLYPKYHRLVRGTPEVTDWDEVRRALYNNPDLLVVVTSVVEGKGIVYEYVIAEGATHAGAGPRPSILVSGRAPVLADRELQVNFKVRNVAKLVVPVFPRPGFPGWQMTLCTPEGWLRLGYQWRGPWMPQWSIPDDLDAQFATGTAIVHAILDNLYQPLVDLDASSAYASWTGAELEEWKERGWGTPSALLVLPGETRSMRVHLSGDGRNYRLHPEEQDADFVEEHMADGVWLNIVGIDNIFGSARAAEWGFAGFPTPYKIVESQLDSLEATASIPAEVRERILVAGYVELPLVHRGQWVGIAPEWLAGGRNLGLSAAADWKKADVSSGDDGCAKLTNRSLLTPLWAKPEHMKLDPITPSIFEFYVRGSNLLNNLRNFRMFTDATRENKGGVQSPAPFVVNRASSRWQVYVPDEGDNNTTPVAGDPITWLFRTYEPATINNLEVKLYLPATRLLLHEQLTAAFPASLLFGAPRYRVVIPKENIPAGAVRLWVFRTRALLDNDWEDEEYGVAARLVIGDKERHGGIDWLDTVKDADLDFSADWRNYMFRRSGLRSCFAAEVNSVVYYGHLITDDYTGNMGEPNRYFGQDSLQSQLYQTPVWTFTSNDGDIPLALPVATESTPMPLGLTEGDRRRIERAAPAYVRQSWVDEVGPNHEDVVWQVYPARSIYRSAVRLSADKYGLFPSQRLEEFRTSNNIAWSSLPSTLTLWLYESRQRQAPPESGRVWRVYEVLYRNAETPEWGWIAARWLVSPGRVLGTRGATTVAITGIPVHQRHTTGFQTLVREYVLELANTITPQDLWTLLDQGQELEIGELREWTITDPRGVWHSEMPDYVVQRTTNMRFRAERLREKENAYQLRLYQRTEGESWEEREPVEAHLVNYEPDAVAWSVPGVPHNIPEGNILRVGQNTGGGISGLAVRESELVVFKRSAIYRLALLPDNPDMPIGRVDEISNSLGCIAPATIARVGQDVFFLSTNGVAVLSGATVRLLDEPVNAEIVWRLNRASLTGAGRRELATATFFAARNAYVLCLPVSRYDDPMFVEHQTVDAEEQSANLMEWHSLAGELFVFDLQRNYVTKFQFNLPGEDDYRDNVERRVYISEARQDLERMMLLDSPLGLQLIGLDLIAPTRPGIAFPPRVVGEGDEPEGGAPLLCNMSILWRSDLYVDNYVHRIRTRFDELDTLNLHITQFTEPSFMPIRFFWRSPWLLLGSLSDKRLRRVDIWVEPLAIRETCGHQITDANGNPIPWYRSGRLRVRSLHVSRRADRPKGGNLVDYSGNWRADGWIPMPPRTALLWAQPFDTQRVPLYPVPDPSGPNIVELHDYVWRDRTIPLGILVLRYGNQASRIFPRGSVWELVVDMPRLEYVTPDILNPSVYRSRGGLDAGREAGIAFAAEVENWGYTVLRGYAMYVRQVRSYLP